MMTSLTPWVKRILIFWAGLWVISNLLYLADYDLGMHFGLFPAALADGKLTSILGLVTYAFLHEPTGILHLAFNSLVFYWTGPEVERHFPGKKFLHFLAGVILVGAAVRVTLYFVFGTVFGYPALGGSGIAMACLAALAALHPGLRVNLLVLTVRLLPLFLVLAGLDLLRMIATIAGKGDSIASEIHLAGALVGWYWGGGFHRFPVFRNWAEKRDLARRQRNHAKKQQDEEELDRILAKISREGIGSLSPAEKAFLDRRSRRPD